LKKIGVLFGMENSFPSALVDKINAMEIEGLRAEFVHLGGVTMAAPSGYTVILDRISHDMPFYRAYLKNAVLTGTHVINNPFWWSADDKFFNYALAAKLGIAVPNTILLPPKYHPPQINSRSLRNLQYPLDWDAVFDYIGFPAFLKPHDGGGWRDVFKVHHRDEFFHAYDQTRDLCMVLQAAVGFQQYFRCYVVGQSEVRIMPYDPHQSHEHRYLRDVSSVEAKLLQRMEKDALTLCKALGYDLNTVEFAVANGTPYAIDFMNPAPDADLPSVGEDNFAWIVDAVARLAVKKAQSVETAVLQDHWASFLAPAVTGAADLKPPSRSAPPKAAAKKVKPNSSTPSTPRKMVKKAAKSKEP
jgi:glutathione synthase/RimK-type ligase-like ATP-grasp enzyme